VQVSEVIFETFEWREGVFTFWDKVPHPTTAVMLEMDLQNLLMEGVRRSDERERLNEVFPDLERVVESVARDLVEYETLEGATLAAHLAVVRAVPGRAVDGPDPTL